MTWRSPTHKLRRLWVPMTEQILLAAEKDIIAVETTVPMAVDRNVLAAEKMPAYIPRITTGASRNPPIIMCAKVVKVFLIIDAMNPRSGFGRDEPLRKTGDGRRACKVLGGAGVARGVQATQKKYQEGLTAPVRARSPSVRSPRLFTNYLQLAAVRH